MQAITQQWVNKAEGDWESANREGQVQLKPNNDLVCYLAQQCAEKYLKARLQEANLVFPKTHNLPVLLVLVLPVEASWNVLRTALIKLDDYSVEFRYPGRDAIAADAQDALLLCSQVREAARRSFGLPL
ncbi:MAG: HEPN domain-containing protein [Janthinobacterium lividum]